jgi:2-polyprenyl-6-methoxyphenol hydroxylase-like FAD-dependent oxidoreductase
VRFDIVIVGAGIGGAVLALDLGRRGWRVALVERESAPPRLARPEVLWGATLRALEPYGVADAIRQTASVQVEEVEIGGENPWLRITRDDFAAAGAEGFSTNPSMTRAIIADAAIATGNVDVHRGVAVEDLVYSDGRVTGVHGKHGDATLELEARLVVGDDGGSSVVRTRLGIPITLDTIPIDLVTAMIRHWPMPPHRVRVWLHPAGFADVLQGAAFIPWPENEGVVLMPLAADRAKRLFEQPPEVFWSTLERVTPMAGAVREQVEFPRDFRRFARPFGHVASYVSNGAALIGDAAHPMTPAGGQGANASIWDALALADVADAALRTGEGSRERLLPYERMRRPANDKSLAFSRAARRIFRVGRFFPLAIVLPPIARTMNALGWPPRKILASFATAFVHRRDNESQTR